MEFGLERVVVEFEGNLPDRNEDSAATWSALTGKWKEEWVVRRHSAS